MLPRLLTSVLILFGFVGPVAARMLAVEVEILHVAGLLSQAELNTLLASPQLRIEAHYQPSRLIDGETARREKIMPIGSKLFAISQRTIIEGAQISRQGRTLRVTADDAHPAHSSYRLDSLRLIVPLPPGPGRPQPDLDVTLAAPVERNGAHESVFLNRNAAFELGLRVRYRWDDAKGEYQLAPPSCNGDIQSIGQGKYRFRPVQRLLRLFGTVDFGTYSTKAPPGIRRFSLLPPLPAPLADWQVSEQQLAQLRSDGKLLESLMLRVERKGADGCRYMRNYDAWFADGKLVQLKRSGYGMYTATCEEPSATDPSVELRWNDDGSLAYFMESTRLGTRLWDGFLATNPACSGEMSQPRAAEVESLRDELLRLRAAFLKGEKP